MADSASAYGTIHLNVSIDGKDAEKKADAEFERIAKALGKSFQKHFDDSFERGLAKEMSETVRQASEKAEKSAKPVKIPAELDATKLEAQVKRLEAKERRLRIQAEAGVDGAEEKLQAFLNKRRAAKIVGEAELTKANAELDAAANKKRVAELGAEVKDAGAKAQLDKLAARRQAQIDVQQRGAAKAAAEIDFAARDRETKINVKTSGGGASGVLGGITGGLGGLVQKASQAGSVLGSLGSSLGQVAGKSIGPQAALSIGAIAAAATAAVGVLPLLATGFAAAAGAAGVAALGFRGVGDALEEAKKNSEDVEERMKAQAAAANAVKAAQSSLAGAYSGLAGASNSLKSAQEGLKAAQSAAALATKDAAREIKDAAQGVKDAQAGAAQANKAAAQAVVEAQNRVKDAVRSAADANKDAAEAVVDAQNRVKDAVRDAADANVDAARRVKDAEDDLEDSQKDARRAQEDLNDARKDASQRLKEYKSELAGAALDERGAILSLKEAEAELAAIRNDPKADALDRERAALRVDRAKQELLDTKARNAELQREADDANKKGVEGAEGVKRAKDAVKDANDRVKDSETNLKDARDQQNRTELEGIEKVKEARKLLAEARAEQIRTEKEGAENVKKAEQALAEARAQQQKTEAEGRRAIADAEDRLARARDNAARTAEANATSIAQAQRSVEEAQRGVADAQRNVDDAQRNVNQAMKDAEDAGKAATKAYDNLSPAAQNFVDKLISLQPVLKDLTDLAATAMFDKFITAIEKFQKNKKLGEGIKTLITGVGEAIGDVAIAFADAFSGKEGEEFVDFLNDTLPDAVRSLGDVGIQLTRIGAGLLKAMGPAGMVLLRDFTDWLEDLANWTNSKKGQEELTTFFNDLVPVVRGMASAIGGLLKIMWEIGKSGVKNNAFEPLTKLGQFISFVGDVFGKHPKLADLLWKVSEATSSFGQINIAKDFALPITQFLRDVVDFDFGAKIEEFKKFGEDLIGGLFEGVDSKLETFWTTASTWFQTNIVDPIKEFFGIKSPSTLAKGWGGDLIQGMKDGVLEKLQDWATKIPGQFKDFVVDVVRKCLGLDEKAGGEGGKAGKSFIQHMRDQALANLKDWGIKLPGQLKDNIVDIIRGWLGLDEKTGGKGGKAGDDFLQHMRDRALANLKDWGIKLPNQLKTNIVDIIRGWLGLDDKDGGKGGKAGNDLLQNLRDAALKNLKDWATKLPGQFKTNVVDVVRGFFGLDSKESKFYRLGSDVIGGMIDGVKSKMSALKDAFKSPITWIIEKVINGGIIKGVNTLLDKVLPDAAAKKLKIPDVPLPKFATGGYVSGPGTGTSDDIPAMLSNGEFVMTAKATKRIGVSRLNQLNRMGTDYGGDPGGVFINRGFGRPGFAGGGLVESRVKRVKEWLPSVDPKPYVWGAVGPNAFDCSGLVGEVFNQLTGIPRNTRRFTTKDDPSKRGFKRGKGTFTMGLQPRQHMAGNVGGLKFEARSTKTGIFVGPSAKGVEKFPEQWYLPVVGDQFTGGGSGIYDSSVAGDAAKDLLAGFDSAITSAKSTPVEGDKFLKPVAEAKVEETKKAVEEMGFLDYMRWIGKGYFKLMKELFYGIPEMAAKAGRGALGTIKNVASGLFNSGGGDADAPPSTTGNPDRDENVNILKGVAKGRSWDTGNQWNSLYQLVTHESGFNNFAQNPSTSAYGMFQFLDGTWAGTGYRKTSDPTIQSKAGLQYIANHPQYGTPAKAWNMWQSRDPHWYDQGGWLGPGDVGLNGTGKPEAVFTNEQWQIIKQAVEGHVNGGGGNTYINVKSEDDRRLAGQIRRELDVRDLKLSLTGN